MQRAIFCLIGFFRNVIATMSDGSDLSLPHISHTEGVKVGDGRTKCRFLTQEIEVLHFTGCPACGFGNKTT